MSSFLEVESMSVVELVSISSSVKSKSNPIVSFKMIGFKISFKPTSRYWYDEVEEVEAEEIPNEEFDELVINTRPIVIDASYFEQSDNSGAIGLGDNCETEGESTFFDSVFDDLDSPEDFPDLSSDDESEVNQLDGSSINEKDSERFTVRNKNRF